MKITALLSTIFLLVRALSSAQGTVISPPASGFHAGPSVGLVVPSYVAIDVPSPELGPGISHATASAAEGGFSVVIGRSVGRCVAKRIVISESGSGRETVRRASRRVLLTSGDVSSQLPRSETQVELSPSGGWLPFQENLEGLVGRAVRTASGRREPKLIIYEVGIF